MSEIKYDLHNFNLEPIEHNSGCPAASGPRRIKGELIDRLDRDLVRGPDVRGMVQTAADGEGNPIYGEGVVPGPRKVRVRCTDCAAQKMIDVDPAALAGLQVEGGDDDGEE